MNKIISNKRRITIREVSDDVGISFASFQAIFTVVLDMKCPAAKIVPTYEILTTFNDNPDLLKKIITGDESWINGYGIETKAQSSQWKRPAEPRPKKAL